MVFEDASLTYGELNARANQLAHHLQTSGVGPEVVVGLCVERSLEMIVGLIGILKAGGAYLPLDPSYPQDRLAFMLDDAAAPVLLTQSALLECSPPRRQNRLSGRRLERRSPTSHDGPAQRLHPANAAYVIYTSGSTGHPKGVVVDSREPRQQDRRARARFFRRQSLPISARYFVWVRRRDRADIVTALWWRRSCRHQ